MTTKFGSVVATLLVLTLFGGVLAGAAVAASGGSISASPPTPGKTSTHTANATIGSDATGSWNGFEVDYSDAGADASDVSMVDVQKIGIDRGNDDAGSNVDTVVRDDLSQVSTSNNGQTLTFTLGGSYSLNESDQVVVVYTNVTNPDTAGTYDVALDVNPQSSGGQTSASLDIHSPDSGDESTTQTGTTQSTTTTTSSSSGTTQSDSGGSGGSNDGSTTTTQASSPGFGIAVGALALFGAALVALWRQD